jgi:thiol-disulfide isomerase/thioredoxin
MKSNTDVSRELLYEYDVVLVDIGRFDKNLDVAAKYDADFKSNGVPYLTILDADANVLANQKTDPFEVEIDGKPGHDPERVLAFLTKYQADYLSAESVLNDGLAEAKTRSKRVFLHFGAPWCPWCHKLDDWMARKDVAKVLAKDYVDIKIDVDRMIGGKELLARYRKSDDGGIPWIVILDPDAKPVVNSTGPKGNIGFPVTDEEIAYFKTMLDKSTRTMTDDDRAMLIKSLEKKDEQGAHGG